LLPSGELSEARSARSLFERPRQKRALDDITGIVSLIMNNILLSIFLVGSAATWRRSGYWLPALVSLDVAVRRRVLVLGGIAITLLATGFALGDAIGGRAQIARSPVQYATRLSGVAAHHHDVADAGLYWRQVVFEAAFGVLIGGSLILLGRPSRPITRPVV
jgi:hypothetical protein